jgi:hypothetical protein
MAAVAGSARRARILECMVGHGEIRLFEELPGDHFEGHFEGQNAASGRQFKLAAAGVS